MTNRPTGTIVAGGWPNGEEGAQWLNALSAFVSQLLGGQAPTERTISGGAIVPNRAMHVVDTEGDAASDDLTTISNTHLPSGSILILRAAAEGRTVVVKNSTSIALVTAADLALVNPTMALCLVRDSDVWREIFRSYGDQTGAQRAFLGLSEAATYPIAELTQARAGTASDKLVTVQRAADMLATAALMIGNRQALTGGLNGDQILVERGGALYRMTRSAYLSGFNQPWDSGEIAINDLAGEIPVTGDNAFTGPPQRVDAAFICKSATGSAGYQVGDVIQAASAFAFGVAFRPGDPAKLIWNRGNEFQLNRATGGSSSYDPVTLSSFRLRVRAWA